MQFTFTIQDQKKCFLLFLTMLLLCLFKNFSFAQSRVYANDQSVGVTGVCAACSVTNAGNSVNNNRSDYATLNITLGLLVPPSTYQTLLFPSANKPVAGTPVSVKLGTGDQLLSLDVLGAITLQAFNGNTAIGQAVAASSLISALSNNNQVEVAFIPQQNYDRIRVTLNGGIVAALSNVYVYGAYFNVSGTVACDAAIDELNGISSGLLGLGANIGGVINPQQAIDGDINTASTLNAGVGLTGAFAQQTIVFAGPSVLGDSARLTLSLPQALLDAGVLGNIQVSTANGTTDNADNQNLSSSLLNVRLLSTGTNGRTVVVAFAPSKIFDRVQISLGGGVANVLSSLNLYEAPRLIPSPVVSINGIVANNITACTGTSVALSTTARANTVFRWYTTATGGSAVFEGNSFETPALTATTTYYAEAVRNGCTNASARTPVIINVSPVPAAPVVVNDVIAVCPGQRASFTAQNMAGVSVNWYAAATGGTAIFTGNTFTTPALTSTQKYYAEALVNGQCASTSRKEVTATVNPLPANPTVTAVTVTVCSGNPAMLSIAQPVTGVQYNWYNSLSGGTPLYTGTNFTTAALTASTSFYIEAVNTNNCTSAERTLVNVTVQPKPANPIVATNNSTINAGQMATLTITNAQTGVTYNWYTAATATTPVFSGSTYQTPALYNTTSYYVEAVNGNNCTADNRTQTTITVNININAPCSFANQQSSDINAVCVGCAITNRALAVDADTTTASTISILAGLVGGNATQELRFQQPGIAGDTIKVVVQSPTGLADVAATGAIVVEVLNGTTVVNTYTLDNSTVKVRVLGGGNRYAIIVPATAAYDAVRIKLNSGTASLINSLQVFYSAQQYPKPVFNIINPQICKNSTAQINISSPATGTFDWFATPTGGSAVFTGTNYTTPALTATTTYYIAYTRNGCAAAVRYPVTIQVDDVPVKPTSAFNNVTICANETVTLTATSAANTIIKWYTTATGSNAVFTGENFTTPALTANTTYYAESSLGSCVSADRTAITVNVNQSPANFVVTPVTQTVNSGGSAAFTASASTANASFSWYNSATGGTSFYTGASYTTPAIFSNTNYYVEAVSETGCRSASRIAVTATINQMASNAVPCDAAIDQTTDINGLACVNCTVSNPQNAVDQNSNSFSQLNVAVGLVNAYAQQTLRFANTATAGDSVVVDLGLPVNLANVSVLSQIQFATFNGTTYNNDRFSIDNTIANVRVLADQNRIRIVFKATKDFDRVEVRLNSTVAGLLTSLKIYDAAQEVAAPVISAANAANCAGTQTTLTATVPAYVTVNWYDAATGGTPIFSGSTFTTPVLTATTTFYAEAVKSTTGCTQTYRTPQTITVTPQPAVPVVPVDEVTVCAGQRASFTAQNLAGITYNWFTAPNGGNPVFTGNTFVSDPLTASTKFYVEASVNGQCTSTTRKEVTANVNGAVADPVIAQSSVQACAGTAATLSATSPQAGVTFQWFTSATATTPVFTGTNFITPVLTANKTYYVQALSGSCVSPDKVAVNVAVNPAPDAPSVTLNPANGTVAAGQTATLTASSTTPGVTFRYYAAAQGGMPLFEGTTFTTPALSTNTTYYVEAVSPSGCVSLSRTTVNIAVDPVFSTTCDFASTQTNNIDNLCAGCTITNPDNAVDADVTNFARMSIPLGLTGGSITQRLTFADQGVAGDTIQILVRVPSSILSTQLLNGLRLTSYNGTTSNNDQVNANTNLVGLQVLSGGDRALLKFAPQVPFTAVELQLVAGAASALTTLDVFYATKQVAIPQLTQSNVAVCAGSKAVFTIVNPKANVVYEWYDAPTGGTLLFTGTTYTSADLTANTVFYVQSKRASSNCINPSRVAATATVTAVPVTPVLAQTSFTICAGEAVNLAVTNAGSYTVKWYNAATGGELLFTGASFQTPAIVTSTHFYAEVSNGDCLSPARAAVTVTVNPRPAQAGFVESEVSVCAGSTASLAISNPESNVTYNWFTAQTGGNTVFTGINYTTPAITQNTTYYVEATSTTGNCTNNSDRAAVNITVTNTINPPVLSSTQNQVCTGGSVTIAVVNPSSNLIYNWFTTASGGNAVFTGTSFTLNNLTANAAFYVEATNGQGCISASRTETAITIIPAAATPAVQSSGLMVCEGNNTTISISNPQNDLVYRWYNSSAGSVPVFTGNEFTTPALTANTIYYVEAAGGQSCNPSARLAVNITVNPLPVAPVLANGTDTICAGEKATFTIVAPVAGVVYRWFDAPSKTNKLAEGSTFVTNPLSASADFYVDGISASGCVSSAVTIAHVMVGATPTAPLLVNQNVSVCSGSPAVLTVTNPQAGITYNWFDAATGGNLLFSGNSFTTPAITANTTYYAEASRNGNCTSASRTAANISITTAPEAATVNAQGTTVCAGNTTTLTASSATANASFNWYLSVTGGTSVFTGSSYTTPVLTANTTYYVETVNSTGCAAATRTTVNVTVGSGTAPAPQIAQTGLSVCQNGVTVLAILNPATGTTYNWYNAATGGTSTFTGSSFNTPALSASTTYYVAATAAGFCNPSARTAVTVTVNAAPQAPVASAQGTNICAGNTTVLAATADAGTTVKWYDSATGGTELYTGTSFVTPVLNANTTYYAAAISNANNCISNRTPVAVTVAGKLATPVVSVSNTTSSTVTFSWKAITGATSYEISLDNGATFTAAGSGGSALSYTATGLKPAQSVTIIVRAKGVSDCQTSANSQSVTGTTSNPIGNLVWVPNAFSPNGDGNNDILYVYGNTIKAINFNVYSQWGELLFNSTSVSTGWDGTYKGAVQPVGVYVYVLEATTNDGQTVRLKGMINLIK